MIFEYVSAPFPVSVNATARTSSEFYLETLYILRLEPF